MAKNQQRLDDLAEELTRRLCIPFKPTSRGAIAFRDRLRLTDWAVPLMFDGHARRDDDAVIPTDFVGHLLWPTLRSSRDSAGERPWWYCTITPAVADALVEAMREEDDRTDDDGGWVIGVDVLLEEIAPPAARRRVA